MPYSKSCSRTCLFSYIIRSLARAVLLCWAYFTVYTYKKLVPPPGWRHYCSRVISAQTGQRIKGSSLSTVWLILATIFALAFVCCTQFLQFFLLCCLCGALCRWQPIASDHSGPLRHTGRGWGAFWSLPTSPSSRIRNWHPPKRNTHIKINHHMSVQSAQTKRRDRNEGKSLHDAPFSTAWRWCCAYLTVIVSGCAYQRLSLFVCGGEKNGGKTPTNQPQKVRKNKKGENKFTIIRHKQTERTNP